MLMTEIREIAKQRGVQPGRMNKTDLIRSIQTKEGNLPCFQAARDFCDQTDCLWRSDCLPMEQKSKVLKRINADMGELKEKIAQLQKWTKQLAGTAKAEAHEEAMRLEEKYLQLKQKVSDIGHGGGEEALGNLKSRVASIYDDVSKSVKKVLSMKQERRP